MNRLQSLISLGLAFVALTANADDQALHRRLTGKDGWVAYHVAMVAGAGAPCCYSGGIGELKKSECNLDTRRGTVVSNDSASGPAAELSIYWHTGNGKLDQVRAYAADCPVTSGEAIRWIDPVDAKDSIAATAAWVGESHSRRNSEGVVALALHADDSATAELISLADEARHVDLRKEAIFWLGQARGAEGAYFVEAVAKGDGNSEVREHAVFALSQSDEKDAYERVRRISREDRSGEVRGNALFWMAQMKDPRAAADIDAALTTETSEDAREQAIFALSQLDDGVATPALIKVIRGNYPRSAKEKALFWLGQSGTDEAIAFLDEVLSR